MLRLTLLAALWEVSEPDPERSPHLKIFPATWAALYPQSADTKYSIARALAAQGDLAEARRHFERALATGEKTKEDLYYDYAVLLVRTRADRQSIDRALGTWKRFFPFSNRPDPMTATDPPLKTAH